MRAHVTPVRTLVKAATALASWGVFGAAWWQVFRRHAQVHPAVLAGLVLVALAVWLITLLWVSRSRRIYRIKGPRRAVAVPAAPRIADRLGRPLVIMPAARHTGEVVLRLTADGRKAYEPAEVSR